jgi:hypothetical protein
MSVWTLMNNWVTSEELSGVDIVMIQRTEVTNSDTGRLLQASYQVEVVYDESSGSGEAPDVITAIKEAIQEAKTKANQGVH